MPFKLVPPGTRKGNPCYLVRGTVDGRRIEVSAKTRDRAAAQRFAKELEAELRTRRVPRPGEAVTFAEAARLYEDFKSPRRPDQVRIARLVAHMGRKFIGDITQADLVDAARLLHAESAAATKNREVLRPAAAILHYAADCRLCPWLRVKLFKEPRPKTRAVTIDIAANVVEACPPGRKRLLAVWLFRQGTRITDSLHMTWEDNIALSRRVVRLRVGKMDDWRELPLHDEVFDLLAEIPEAERHGRLFPWRTKSGVYKWLTPLMREHGITFTPHMARHSLGMWLNEHGAGLRTIMEALTHLDEKSSIRYQSADVEIVRAAAQKIGGISGGSSAKARKA